MKVLNLTAKQIARQIVGKRYYHKRCIKERQTHFCIDCGIGILKVATRCRSCKAKYLVAIGKIKLHNKGGDKHSCWKGGRTKTGKGYILIKQREHPRAQKNGYVLEHILIWEETYGKPLPKGWVIHHLNGVRDDNRPQNLVALPDSKHRLVLAAKAKRIQELEALLNNQHQLL